MSRAALTIVEPSGPLTLCLGPGSPVQSAPVALQAVLVADGRDVSSEATFQWSLSWRGTYRTYRTEIAIGAAPTVPVPVGGHLLIVEANHHGSRHVATRKAIITGTNPTATDVAAAIGVDDLLKAVCWKESTWRQFNALGEPLMPSRTRQNRQPSARGIGQILERYWGKPAGVIKHNDYVRVAWQWDYCIEAARDILVYYTGFVRSNKPGTRGVDQLAWLFACYHHGQSSLDNISVPTEDKYAKAILGFMADKPWEGLIR